ncbi:MAG: hypothetical protein ABIO43_05875 [Sphingomicrobium sp.]
MVQNNNELPEGTDSIIAGASKSGSEASENDSLVIDSSASSKSSGSWTEKLRGETENLSTQAGTKARDLLGQGMERGSEALANVARMVGDTASGLDERLGQEYGDYARRAAGSIESAANGLAAKDADALLEDSREFIRKSPGVALAGAAIIGFALARLLKNGLASTKDDDGKPGPTRFAD